MQEILQAKRLVLPDVVREWTEVGVVFFTSMLLSAPATQMEVRLSRWTTVLVLLGVSVVVGTDGDRAAGHY